MKWWTWFTVVSPVDSILTEHNTTLKPTWLLWSQNRTIYDRTIGWKPKVSKKCVINYILNLESMHLLLKTAQFMSHNAKLLNRSRLFFYFCLRSTHITVNSPFGCAKLGHKDGEWTTSLRGFYLLILRIAPWADKSSLYPCEVWCVILFGLGNCFLPYVTFVL